MIQILVVLLAQQVLCSLSLLLHAICSYSLFERQIILAEWANVTGQATLQEIKEVLLFLKGI